MKLIIGLGNPGEIYKKTRHNIGKRLAEFIAEKDSTVFSEKKSHKISLAELSFKNAPKLGFPLTFMNLSGEAVGNAVRYWKINPSTDLLIIVDDVALPFGKLRLRGEGSSGGHNGLASIEAHLGTSEYARLRIGIGEAKAASGDPIYLADYVLGKFSQDEERQMAEVFNAGAEAVKLWSECPLAQAMNKINASV